MTGFTFYKSFYETIKKIRNSRDRANAILAICEYMFEDKVPDENTSETVEIVFQSVRHTLDKSKKNGVSGSETKPKRTHIETKSNDNRNQIELQSNENRNEIETETRSRSSSRLSSSSSSSISSITPLFISPQSGDEKNPLADEFFSKYPRYAKDRAKMRADVDYKRLIEEFEKSSYLRSLYTVKQINDIYSLIISGDYRDKETTPSSVADADARGERERWYAKRRQEAQSKADRAKRKLLEQYPWYSDYEIGEGKAEIALAKAEVAFEKAQSQETEAALEEAKKELAHFKAQKASVLECAGMTEEDLEPKWSCRKCQDTGFVNGVGCDCYEG